MEKFFGELIVMRLILGRLLANQAYASGDPKGFLKDQMDQTKKDLAAVAITGKDKNQEDMIRKMGELSLEDIFNRIKFPAND